MPTLGRISTVTNTRHRGGNGSTLKELDSPLFLSNLKLGNDRGLLGPGAALRVTA